MASGDAMLIEVAAKHAFCRHVDNPLPSVVTQTRCFVSYRIEKSGGMLFHKTYSVLSTRGCKVHSVLALTYVDLARVMLRRRSYQGGSKNPPDHII